MERILLDTHIFIWMLTKEKKINNKIEHRIKEYIPGRRILISAISIWEIAILVQKGRLQFTLPLKQWIEKAVTTPGLTVVPLDSKILLESCLLPGEIHGDPADRMIISTARIENAELFTRDERILEYASQGHIVATKS